MSFENPSLTNVPDKKQAELEPSQEKPIRAHEEETSVLGSSKFFQAILSENLEDCASVSEAHQATKETIEHIEHSYGEKAAGFSRCLDGIEISGITSVKEYIETVSPILEKVMYNRLPLEELEEIQRNDILSHESNKNINKIVYYKINPEKNKISINLHNAKSIPFKEILRGFSDGLKEIAQKMKNDPDLALIQEVTARSWIIEKHPQIAERYGFKLDSIDSISISREDFMNRYGN